MKTQDFQFWDSYSDIPEDKISSIVEVKATILATSEKAYKLDITDCEFNRRAVLSRFGVSWFPKSQITKIYIKGDECHAHIKYWVMKAKEFCK